MDIVVRREHMSRGVESLDEEPEFYSGLVRLDVTEQVGDTAFMTGGVEHHWIRVEDGNRQGIKRIGVPGSALEWEVPR
jgi:2,3-dihydroxy-p-cumate/2,3-dihydroxybenzoate 3,4-dioxygenase